MGRPLGISDQTFYGLLKMQEGSHFKYFHLPCQSSESDNPPPLDSRCLSCPLLNRILVDAQWQDLEQSTSNRSNVSCKDCDCLSYDLVSLMDGNVLDE
jgi:hypothetical protein